MYLPLPHTTQPRELLAPITKQHNLNQHINKTQKCPLSTSIALRLPDKTLVKNQDFTYTDHKVNEYLLTFERKSFLGIRVMIVIYNPKNDLLQWNNAN